VRPCGEPGTGTPFRDLQHAPYLSANEKSRSDTEKPRQKKPNRPFEENRHSPKNQFDKCKIRSIVINRYRKKKGHEEFNQQRLQF